MTDFSRLSVGRFAHYQKQARVLRGLYERAKCSTPEQLLQKWDESERELEKLRAAVRNQKGAAE